ncbi:GNAT family N-acetyltransferase [Vibrio kyushuensis]|uniref:GNAT family N-acetyltransferase n=1 Tax=Vibrio kyushuensis TaxID=2910249 RepID=UPI003D0FA83D
MSIKISSQRLDMVSITEDDWELFRSLHTDPAVISLCFDEPSTEELSERFRSRLPHWSTKSSHWLCLTIALRETGEQVGITGLKFNNGVAEVGYLLLPQFYGFGFATESLMAVLNWASNTHGIFAYNAVVTEGNFSSERVLLKCGFRLKEVIPDAYDIGGKVYADNIYSIENIDTLQGKQLGIQGQT